MTSVVLMLVGEHIFEPYDEEDDGVGLDNRGDGFVSRF